MSLAPLGEAAIDAILDTDDELRMLVLTSGETLYAPKILSLEELASRYGDNYPLQDLFRTDAEIDTDEELVVVEYRTNGKDDFIAVPYAEIADCISLPVLNFPDDAPPPEEISETGVTMYRQAIRLAKESDYLIGSRRIIFDSPVQLGESFSWEETDFDTDTPLYCDWEYLQRRSGGVKSLGGGALGVSLSVGWDESLWSEFQSVVRSQHTEIDAAGQQEAVATTGHVEFVTHQGSYLTREMDGSEWVASVIASRDISDGDRLDAIPWMVGYFKRDGLMYPLRSWDNIKVPVTVYGNRIESTIETPFGETEWFLKVRAGAYLND